MDLLFDLIKEANPGIEFPFTPSTMKVSIPVSQAIPPGGIVDSNVIISPRTNDHWFGSVKVQYRRIKIANFFKSMAPVPVNFYSPLTMVTPATFVAKINEQYGTSFVVADFSPGYNSYQPGTVMEMGIDSASLCYSPTDSLTRIRFVWRNRKPLLNEVTVNGVLTGRLFPNGNDFVTPGRKPQGEYLAYGIDFTGLGISGSGSGTVPNNAAWIKILAPIFANDPRFDVTKVASGTEGVQGLTFVLYTLPNALVPEANSAKYKNVMTLSGGAGLWFQGRIMMHYN